MDRFDAMRVFTRIVERRSFTRAADDLGLPRSSVTDAVKGLEARLGVRLLQRSTRHVSPTLDGEAYYRRCVNLISDLEDAEAGFTGVKPSGLVRIDVHGTQARHFLLPGLPRFLDVYPDIRLHIGEAHQALDMVREGFDCILRAGELTVDSALIRRRLATLERGTFASPAYISRFGMPESVDALEADGHRMVGFYAPDAPEVAPFNFLDRRQIPSPVLALVHHRNRSRDQCRLGLHGVGPHSDTALSRRRRAGIRQARRSAAAISPARAAGPCPLFTYPAIVAAPAGGDRLDG